MELYKIKDSSSAAEEVVDIRGDWADPDLFL